MAPKNIEQLTFCVFDLETTGLIPVHEKIVEIAAIKFSLKKGIIKEQASLVNPVIPMPPEAQRVHKISDEMLVGKPKIDEALPAFREIFDADVLLGHNPGFDLGFLHYDLGRMNLDWGSKLVLDTVALSKIQFPSSPNHRLETLVRFLSLGPTESHRALADTHTTMQVFLKCLEKFEGYPKIPLEKVAGASPERLFFGADLPELSDLWTEAGQAKNLRDAIESALTKGQTLQVTLRETGGKEDERSLIPLNLYKRGSRFLGDFFWTEKQIKLELPIANLLKVSLPQTSQKSLF